MKISARFAFVAPLLLTLAVFWQVTHFDFVELDDEKYIYQNPYIQDGLTSQGVRWAFCAGLCFSSPHADYWQPSTMISRMLDINLWALNPHGHHATNLALHLANVLLLYFIFLNLSGGKIGLAVWIATAFAIHPAQANVVPWVTARKDVLSLFFGFWTILLYFWYTKKTSWPRYGALLAVYACSLMSKPMLITMPLILLILDYGPLERSQKMAGRYEETKETALRLIFEKWGFFILAASAAGITLFSHSLITESGFFYGQIPVVVWKYVRDFIYPVNLPLFEMFSGGVAGREIFVAGAALIFLTFVLIKAGQAHSFLRTGWLWFLTSLIPVVTLNYVSRFLPLPSLGLLLIVAVGFTQICQRWKISTILRDGAAILLLGVWASVTFMGVKHWQNNLSLGEYNVRVRPKSAQARHMFALALWKNGDADSAVKHLTEAIRLFPNYVWAHSDLALIWAEKKQWEKAVAYSWRVLRLAPLQPEAYNNYGSILAKAGKCSEAIPQYQKALSMYPEFVEARVNFSDCLAKTGKIDESIVECKKALQYVPPDDTVQSYYGFLLVRAGKYEEAIQHFEGLIRRRPKNALAHNGWGITLAFLNQPDEAILHFKEALRINPRLAETYNNLALLLIPQGKHNEAAGYFKKALDLDPHYEKARKNLEKLRADMAKRSS